MSVKKRLLGFIWPHKHLFIASALCGLVLNGCDGYVAKLTKDFAAAMGADGKPTRPEMIPVLAGLYLLMHVPRGIAMFWQIYWTAKATNRIATNLRTDIYTHMLRMSLSFFERSKTGQLMTRVTNDVGLIQNASQSVVDAVTAPTMVVGGIAWMFYISWQLALIVLVFVPLLSLVISRVGRRLRKLTLGLQQKLGDVTSILEETIAGVRIVKSFAMEGHEAAKFRYRNEESLDFALRCARRNATAGSVVDVISALGVAAIIVLGGELVALKYLTMPNLLMFAVVSFFVSSAGRKLGRLAMTYQQMMAGVQRIFEVLDEQPELVDADDAAVLDSVEGLVEFRDVEFAYNNCPTVLNGISLKISPGEVVAVVGPSGAGKSTIANLIPRFYDVTDGAVLVDGHDVRDVTAKSLRHQIGIVPQETILFAGTVRENIAYGKTDATDDEIVAAARAANAHSFISAFADGYETVIGERGVRLSGGERQRISIARALLKDPRILILDEATSSLDADSEKVVQAALEVLMEGRSTLVIAHRLSTITKANKILVLSDGRIVESGSFQELMSKGGLFAQLYRTQFKSDEVAEACEVAR